MEERDEALRKEIESALKRAKNAKGAANMLALLFPKVEAVLKTYVPDSMDGQERTRARRISEKDFSQSYFGLDPQLLVWSLAEIDDIISASEPSALFIEAIHRIERAPEHARSRLRTILLDSLNGAFDETHPFTASWLKDFVEVSPYFISNRDESPEFFGADNLQRMRWIVLNGIKPLDSQKRFEIFSSTIPDAGDLTLLTDIVRVYTPDRHPEAERDNSKRDLFGMQSEELRNLTLNRIGNLVQSGNFWSQADPGPLLWFWWSCNLDKEVKTFTATAAENPLELRVLLRVPISLVRSSEGNYEMIGQYWSKIMDLDDLARRASLLESGGSTPEDRNLAHRFLMALDRGKKGR